jgi:hypothetical protein
LRSTEGRKEKLPIKNDEGVDPLGVLNKSKQSEDPDRSVRRKSATSAINTLFQRTNFVI